jgi:hypothetical protein
MKALAAGLLAATAIFAFAPVAMAEYLIPPGNSAATQYTEAVRPRAAAGHRRRWRRGRDRSPGEVLGSRNAQRLEAMGPQGRATAEVIAATAPGTVATDVPVEAQPAARPDNGQGGREIQPRRRRARTPRLPHRIRRLVGLGEVAGQATGLTSGKTGWLLPLAIVGAIGWSLAFLLRQRKRQPTG